MKKIVDMNGKDRAVTALLGKTAALARGIVTNLLPCWARQKPPGQHKPKPGMRSQRGMLLKGGLRHA